MTVMQSLMVVYTHKGQRIGRPCAFDLLSHRSPRREKRDLVIEGERVGFLENVYDKHEPGHSQIDR